MSTFSGEFHFVQRGLGVPELARALKLGAYFALSPMTEAQIRTAIERPAARVGYRIEAKLVERLVNAAANHVERLPLLQHVLRKLWESRNEDRLTIPYEVYEQTGGLETAIAVAAERTLTQLRCELSDEAVSVTQQLMTRLVHLGDRSGDDTRRRVRLAELNLDKSTEAVINAFVNDARILTAGEVDGSEVLEISHEALLGEWKTLRRWLNAEREALHVRQELAQAGRAWQHLNWYKRYFTSEALWTSARIRAARRRLKGTAVELNQHESAFMRAHGIRLALALAGALFGALLAGFVTALGIVKVGHSEPRAITAAHRIIDASALRDKYVRVQVRMRVHRSQSDGGARAWLRVDSADPKWLSNNLEFESSGTVTSDHWQTYTLELPVANSADEVHFGVNVLKPATVWVDDLRIFAVEDDVLSPLPLPNGDLEFGDTSHWSSATPHFVIELIEESNGNHFLHVGPTGCL